MFHLLLRLFLRLLLLFIVKASQASEILAKPENAFKRPFKGFLTTFKRPVKGL